LPNTWEIIVPFLVDGPLHSFDPEVGAAIDAELQRQRTTLEMIAGENFRSSRCHAGAGFGADQQVRRGLPGHALLRRLRARGRDRAARDRPGHGTVRRPGPLIELNAIASLKSINAACLASNGDGSHKISLDKAIKTMRETGPYMKTRYQETARGGLAVNVIEC
jgi:hypothetical protein